jgi:hypothetical protein
MTLVTQGEADEVDEEEAEEEVSGGGGERSV